MSLLTIAPWFAIALIVVGGLAWFGSWIVSSPARGSSSTGTSASAPPRRGHCVVLLILFAAFALYGSLVPFQFRSLQFAEALQGFAILLRSNLALDSRSDWITNVLLALPLGFCGSAVLGVDRPGLARGIWHAALVVLLSACFSAGLEFAQLWTPLRTSSQNDIAAQTIGAAVGAGLWIAAGQWLTNLARGFFSGHETRRPINSLLLAYSAVLVLYSALPFDLTIRPSELYHKFRDGRVVLQPFTGDEFSTRQISGTTSNALLFATVGMIAASSESRWLKQPPLRRAALWGFCLSLCIETVQLFVLSRFTKTFDILLGTSAASVGGGIRVFLSSLGGSQPSHRGDDLRRAWPWFVLSGIYMIAIVIVFSAPFEWLQDPLRIAKRWKNLWNIPFGYSKYWSDPLEALSDVLLKLLLFGSLGALLARGWAARWISPSRRRFFNGAAVCTCAALSLVIEILQVHLPPHVADMTDVLLAAAGGWLGVMVTAIVLS